MLPISEKRAFSSPLVALFFAHKIERERSFPSVYYGQSYTMLLANVLAIIHFLAGFVPS